MIMDMKMMI